MKTSLYRWFWFIAGIIVNSFGIAFITKASLGTSPISSVPYVLSFQIPFSFGQVSFLVNMLFILGQIILLKSKFKPVQFLQIAVNVLFSACIDWSMAFLSWMNPDSPVTCFLSLLTGCVILALGISIEVAPQVLYVPGEGIVNAIASVSRKKFSTVKVCFDVTLIATAAILSLLFFSRLRGLGIGTLISALLVGKITGFFHKRLPLVSQLEKLAVFSYSNPA